MKKINLNNDRTVDFLIELRNACTTVLASPAEGLNLDWVQASCIGLLENKNVDSKGRRTAYLKDKDYK